MRRIFRIGTIRHHAICVDCSLTYSYWREEKKNGEWFPSPPDLCNACGDKKRETEGRRFHVQQIHDICHMDGATGDAIEMPAFGKRISSRRALRDAQARLPETLYNRTAGDHSTFVRDPVTGKKEKITIHSKGIEIANVRTSESRERPDLGKMAIDNMVREVKKDIAEGKPRWPA